MALRPRRSRAHRLGYTAIEVLVALTLFAVGTAGVLSLQRVSIVGASDARQTDIATAIGAEWVERLRQDSLAWTLPSAADPLGPSNLTTATKILGVNAIPIGPTGTSDAGADTPWITPPTPGSAAALLDLGSPAYDLVGRALTTVDIGSVPPQPPHFCVQYRLQWLVPSPPPTPTSGPPLIRAEVRVLYLTSGGAIGCAAGTGDPIAPAGFPAGFRSIHLTTSLRQNPT